MNRHKKSVFKTKYYTIFVVFLCTAIFLSSLFFINFGMVKATWNDQISIEGFEINNATGELKKTLYLYIDNSSLFSQYIRPILLEKLNNQPISTELVFSLNKVNSPNNSSFLGIHITKEFCNYLPWSVDCKYCIFYYYSDIANTNYYNAFRTSKTMYDQPPVIFNSSDGAQVINIGDIQIQGSFNGFFSKPKTTEVITDHIASVIMKEINK